MSAFHIWLTIALPSEILKLVSNLIVKGYSVSAATEDKEFIIFNENNTNGVFSCKIEKNEIDLKELYEDIYQVLTTYDIEYYSLIISEFTINAMWNFGNVIDMKLPQTKISKKQMN